MICIVAGLKPARAGAHRVVQAGGQTSHPDIADSNETFQGRGKPAMKGLKACHVLTA